VIVVTSGEDVVGFLLAREPPPMLPAGAVRAVVRSVRAGAASAAAAAVTARVCVARARVRLARGRRAARARCPSTACWVTPATDGAPAVTGAPELEPKLDAIVATGVDAAGVVNGDVPCVPFATGSGDEEPSSLGLPDSPEPSPFLASLRRTSSSLRCTASSLWRSRSSLLWRSRSSRRWAIEPGGESAAGEDVLGACSAAACGWVLVRWSAAAVPWPVVVVV
jgi:hypothetical protein